MIKSRFLLSAYLTAGKQLVPITDDEVVDQQYELIFWEEPQRQVAWRSYEFLLGKGGTLLFKDKIKSLSSD